MEIISVIAEFDQDKQERYVKVKLYDNELDEFREAMQRHRDTFLTQMNNTDNEDKKRLVRIQKGLDAIQHCWDLTNPS